MPSSPVYHSTKENQSNWHEIELHFVKVDRVKFDWFKIALIRRFIYICFFKINDNNRSWDYYFYAYLNFYFILVLCLLSDIVFIYIILYLISQRFYFFIIKWNFFFFHSINTCSNVKSILEWTMQKEWIFYELNGNDVGQKCMLLHCYVNYYRNNRPYKAICLSCLPGECMWHFRKQSSKKDRIEVTSEKSIC